MCLCALNVHISSSAAGDDPDPERQLGVALCHGTVWHFSQRGGVDDGAGWACGYRNLQMLVGGAEACRWWLVGGRLCSTVMGQ